MQIILDPSIIDLPTSTASFESVTLPIQTIDEFKTFFGTLLPTESENLLFQEVSLILTSEDVKQDKFISKFEDITLDFNNSNESLTSDFKYNMEENILGDTELFLFDDGIPIFESIDEKTPPLPPQLLKVEELEKLEEETNKILKKQNLLNSDINLSTLKIKEMINKPERLLINRIEFEKEKSNQIPKKFFFNYELPEWPSIPIEKEKLRKNELLNNNSEFNSRRNELFLTPISSKPFEDFQSEGIGVVEGEIQFDNYNREIQNFNESNILEMIRNVEENVIEFNDIISNNREEVTKTFYDILTLYSKGLIKIKQKNPFGKIKIIKIN